MAEFFPIRSSSPREPNKRPRPVPVKVRSAIRAMIYGAENDPAAKPLNVVRDTEGAAHRRAVAGDWPALVCN